MASGILPSKKEVPFARLDGMRAREDMRVSEAKVQALHLYVDFRGITFETIIKQVSE